MVMEGNRNKINRKRKRFRFRMRRVPKVVIAEG